MDPANALVLLLCAGGVALLVWFEMNSRANTAKNNQSSSAAQPDMGTVGKQATNTDETDAAKKNAA